MRHARTDRQHTPAPRAFSLIELLIVIGIISVLIAILLPSLSMARTYTRRTVCAANLRSLGLATNTYLDMNTRFWPYYSTVTGADPGRLWWFGFEAGGPGAAGTTNRPLDKSLSPLGPYTANLANLLQCPEFPYSDGSYFPKFDQHAASYGYNIQFLGPAGALTATRLTYINRAASVYVFADGVQFDFGTTFNEGHYMLYTAGAATASGYAHFRHRNAGNWTTQMVFIDGHVESEKFMPPLFRNAADMPAANLYGADGTKSIYGF